MNRLKWLVPLAALLVVTALPHSARAVFVNARFTATNPQIFPVGDLVDIQTIENGDEVDMSTLPDMFQVTINNTTPGELDSSFVVHVTLTVGPTEMISFWSAPFQLNDWIHGPGSNDGTYTNTQLADLESTSWFHQSSIHENTYADVQDFLDLLNGANLSAGTYVVKLDVWNGSETMLKGTYSDRVQVYNPSPPQLQEPTDGAEVTGYPIYFNWNWYGGMIPPSNWKLIIVEGQPGEDGETVIASRNDANTRYIGPPQFETSHSYQGTIGTEEALNPGSTYYWMVTVDVNTVIPGQTQDLESNVFSFTFTEPQAGAAGTTTTTVSNEQGGNDPLLDQLSSILPADLMVSLIQNLQGYSLNSITIDGVSNYTDQDLMRFLNQPDVSVVSVIVE